MDNKISDLYNQGYSAQQINQIEKISNYGFSIDLIKIHHTPEKLRTFCTILKQKERKKKDNNKIFKYLMKDGIDISPILDKGIKNQEKINIFIKFLLHGIPYHDLLNKEYTVQNLDLIFSYKLKKIDIKPLLDKGFKPEEIDVIIQGKKHDIDSEQLLLDGYTVPKIFRIIFAKEKGIDLLKYVDREYSANQMQEITNGIIQLTAEKKEDKISKILNPNYNKRTLNTIIEGLLNDMDITPYLTGKETTYIKAKIILKSLQEGQDPIAIKDIEKEEDLKIVQCAIENNYDYKKILDSEYPKAYYYKLIEAMKKHIKIDDLLCEKYPFYITTEIFALRAKNINADPLLNKNFTREQIDLLVYYLLQGINIDHIANPDYNTELMAAISTCEKYGFTINEPIKSKEPIIGER